MSPDIVFRWEGPPAIELQRCRIELPTGLAYMAHWLITGDGLPGVVVLAVRNSELLLVRTHRPAAGGDFWELPRGFGETPEAAPEAVRELREETGYQAEDVNLVGTYVVDTTVLPTTVQVFQCNVRITETPHERDSEALDVRWVSFASITGLISTGVLQDAHSLAALAMIRSKWHSA